MNPAWHKEAVRLRRAGQSVPDIAAAVGKSPTQVYRMVRAVRSPVSHHRASHMQGKDFDPDLPKKAVRLRRRGIHLAAIARRFGVTRQAVSTVCRKAGLPAGRMNKEKA